MSIIKTGWINKMGGGTPIGNSSWSSGGPMTDEKVQSEIDSALENTKRLEFETEVNVRLKEALSSYNEKDTELVNERLSEIKELLSKYLETSIDIRRGGSWKKHTYIDGLSDVDCLFILNSPEFSGESPKHLNDELKTLLQEKLGNRAKVERGNLSLKITYENVPDLQILLALRNDKGLRIPSGDQDSWSGVINPEKFAKQLTETNKSLNGNVIPVIKIVKGAVIGTGINPDMKGYHVEALAVEIFQGYQGEQTKKAMLEYFFLKASEMVRKPIKEISGQSQYVDDYLGDSGSAERENVSRELKRRSDGLARADYKFSVDDWFNNIGLS
jgi:hypothetical protein